MKKYIFLLILSAMPLLGWCDSVSVGSGTHEQEIIPICNWEMGSSLSGSQIIYLASELSSMPKGSAIKSVSFKSVSRLGNTFGGEFEVRISETAGETFESETDFKIKDTDEVYGTVSLNGLGTGDVTFPLSSPYIYKGGNLVIDIRSTQLGDRKGWIYFVSTETENNRSLRYLYLNENMESGACFNVYPNATFEYDTNVPSPFADANVKEI